MDRLVGFTVFAVFAPSLALLALLVGIACGRPVFEWRLRIDEGAIYRTRRFRMDESCRLGRFLKRYSLDSLPVVLDIAAGRARLEATLSPTLSAPLQSRVTIKAPRPRKSSHPKAASPSHAKTVVE